MPKFKKIPLNQGWAEMKLRTSNEERRIRAFTASIKARKALKEVDKEIKELNTLAPLV